MLAIWIHVSVLFSDDDDEEEEQEEGWGKKKAYWSGDTADLEIGQDVQDAEDEEEAAEVNTILPDFMAAYHQHIILSSFEKYYLRRVWLFTL